MLKALALVALSLAVTTAKADVFSDYSAVGTQITQDIAAKASADKLNKGLLTLATLGYQIMDLYSNKFAECKAQFDQVKTHDAKMLVMSFEDLEVGYHDGGALVQAAKHCYQGRSMVIHPYMAMALIRTGQDGAMNEIMEVVNRSPKIKAKLGL